MQKGPGERIAGPFRQAGTALLALLRLAGVADAAVGDVADDGVLGRSVVFAARLGGGSVLSPGGEVGRELLPPLVTPALVVVVEGRQLLLAPVQVVRLEVVVLVGLTAHAGAGAFPDLGARGVAVGRVAGLLTIAVVHAALHLRAAGEAGAHARLAAHAGAAIRPALAVGRGLAVAPGLAVAALAPPLMAAAHGAAAVARGAAPCAGVAAAVLRLAPLLVLLSGGL